MPRAHVRRALFAVFMAISVPLGTQVPLGATDTEVFYLSGRGTDDAVPWEFYCTAGRRSGVWTTIPVPSNWELHGFGTYNYGHDPEKATEDGLYRRQFDAPASWAGKHLVLVFEGAMTDTDVRINGVSAGPTHRGGFYRFEYDVTRLVKPGSTNLLEVAVSKDSADESINAAERQADYWIFGGIYRPVYVKALPTQHIERVAVDARADGSIRLDVLLGAIRSADTVEAALLDRDGAVVAAPFRHPVAPSQTNITLRANFSNPRLWTAETPHLYHLKIALLARGRPIHRLTETIGFRTVEVRAGDGLYINGRKVRLKGVNRHSSWPDSGRATNAAISRADVELIKDMNMNAVRTAHYPPDEHFLDLCDEMGLYVLDELAGWQAPPYDTAIGERLARQTVVRDVNHPSVILWINGNEGGSNPEIDDTFAIHDPQRRAVLHASDTAGGLNTRHYPAYSDLERTLRGPDVYLPTELLHGLYDGGGGAGLADYWNLMRRSPLSAGGMLWAFADEAVRRTDLGGRLDTDGSNGADGILGPYREKEASFQTVRSIWSPVAIPWSNLPDAFDGKVPIENRYDFIDASRCRFEWSLIDFPEARGSGVGHVVRRSGVASLRSLAPGASGVLELALPSGFREHDALALLAIDPHGRRIGNWTWPLRAPADVARDLVSTEGGRVDATETAETIVLSSGDIKIVFDRTTGKLAHVSNGGRPISFGNGPIIVAKNASASLQSVVHRAGPSRHIVEARFAGNLRATTWTLYGSGWLKLEYEYSLPRRGNAADHDYLGITFTYPEEKVLGVRWLGNGPDRVWKNRLDGPSLGVWAKEWNDTQTGVSWRYPEFQGYYAQLYWAVIRNKERDFVIATDTDGMYLHLFAPQFEDAGLATASFPRGDISILHGISPMGSKFQSSSALGPQSSRNRAHGDFSATVYFFFGIPTAVR